MGTVVEVKINANLLDQSDREFPDPYIRLVHGGDEVSFKAENTRATILLPNCNSFFDCNESDNILEYQLWPGHSQKTPAVQTGLETGTEFEYQIYCHSYLKFAWKNGSSPPKMKIDD